MKLDRKDIDGHDALHCKEKIKRKRPHEFDSRAGGKSKQTADKKHRHG